MRRFAAVALFGIAMAGCSSNTSVAPAGVSNQANAYRESQGLERAPQGRANTRGWIAPDVIRRPPGLIYWANYNNNNITIYPAKGINPPPKGQITTGVSNPERLFVDKALNLYATNATGTVTAYKRGATSPFLTISNGVNVPTGLTVDAAGTVYCANVGNDTITEYPKGQTSPSLTISMGTSLPEYLAIDSSDNLYVSYLGSTHNGVMEFKPGSTKGTILGLNIGSAGALEVDKSGNLIVIDGNTSTIDVFPAGQTQPSKKIPVTAGIPFALSLGGAEKNLYVSVSQGTNFIIQQLPYPNGTALTNKITTPAGEWPIAVSPDAVL